MSSKHSVYVDSDEDSYSNSDNRVEEVSESECLTVSDLTDKIKDALCSAFDYEVVSVVGEISNFKPSRGNVFFKLKDDSASLSAVMWDYDSNKHKFGDITEGKKVKVTGKISLFQKFGTYNITVHDMKLLGEGDINQQYNKLKEKYLKLGYFDDARKQKMPKTINTIGVITAASGAALQDFLYVLKQNNFVGKVHIKGCMVQGAQCPNSVAKSIKQLDEMGLDVIVITRGGGSFEDLFGFSDPKIIEALYNAKTCTMSAIGHEVDFMLSDFVADIRAPTPTNAATVLSADAFSLTEVDTLIESITNIINNRVIRGESQLSTLQKLLKSPQETVDKSLFDIQMLEDKLALIIKNRIFETESNLNDMAHTMNQHQDQQNILAQGYSMVYTNKDVQMTSIKELETYLKTNKKLKIKLQDGEIVLKIK